MKGRQLQSCFVSDMNVPPPAKRPHTVESEFEPSPCVVPYVERECAPCCKICEFLTSTDQARPVPVVALM